MQNAEFYIAFTGRPARFVVLSKFFDRLASVKKALDDGPTPAEVMKKAVSDNGWVDLLDDEAVEVLCSTNAWQLEDILDCVLHGEYNLDSVTFDGQSGRLIYDPWSYPFGGTDPIKALIETFGLQVTRDSFHDGFAEWKSRNSFLGRLCSPLADLISRLCMRRPAP